MIYPFSLQATGLVIGLLLIAAHGFGLARAGDVRAVLPGFPRSRVAGVMLVTLAAAWTFWLMVTMDLGEFSHLRTWLVLLIPVTWVLTLVFVNEFLAVRALGFVLLLGAEIPLEAAFLEPPVTRLLLVVLAYVWIVKGLFWVGMPYLLRDQIDWAVRDAGRWRLLMGAGVAYGVAVVLCALFFWG